MTSIADLSREQLAKLYEFQKELDARIENLKFGHVKLENSMKQIGSFLSKKLNISVFYTEVADEDLENRCFFYTFGTDLKPFKIDMPKESTCFEKDDLIWVAQPIEMSGQNIGVIAFAFKPADCPEKDLAEELLNVVSELVDTFFFDIHERRIKQNIIVLIQEAMKRHSIIDSLDRSMSVLNKELSFRKVLFLYSDYELTGEIHVNYLLYSGAERLADSSEKPDEKIGSYVSAHQDCIVNDTDVVCELAGLEKGPYMVYRLEGLREDELIGKIIFESESGNKFSSFSRDLIQIFSAALVQRLIDFNRERNVLRKYFSDKVITRLLREPAYEKKYMSPRQTEIGILFADLSGFTKISEQIMKTPDRITNLIDKWSQGILDRVFPFGVCLDKLVGDCVILLFGPPFYEFTPEETAQKMVQCARIIVDYTREFLALPENKEIAQHPDFDKFGVAIGCNYCQSVVGLIGPNDDLTAFSSGMNNTARLQGLAHANQIFASDSLASLITKAEIDCRLEGPMSAPVKNVAKPLVYYLVK